VKPTLAEQIEYCDRWLETNKPVEWPSMGVQREGACKPMEFEDVATWTRGKMYMRSDPVNGDHWTYEKAIRPGHWSVLEFSWFVYSITGVSRICTHELVRHRHLSFMQESTRASGKFPPPLDWPSGLPRDEDERYHYLDPWRSSILVAGNGRAWAGMLRKRLCLRAAPEIRWLAYLVAKDLRVVAPLVYACAVPDCERCEERDCDGA